MPPWVNDVSADSHASSVGFALTLPARAALQHGAGQAVRMRIVSVLMIGGVGRGRGRDPPARARAKCESMWSPRTKFFLHYTSRMFRDLPIRARELKATPEMLERIYDAARLGLRGESLALAAGMLPAELARLKIMDPIAEVAEMKGRADSEMEMSRVVFDAAQAGDSKAALEFLRHRHDWVAKTNVQVDVNTQISVVAALEAANGRLQRGLAVEVEDAVEVEPRPVEIPLAREALGEAV